MTRQSTDLPAEKYQFIAIQTPAALRERSNQRLARVHAARTYRREARLREKRFQQNFRVTIVEDMDHRSLQHAELMLQQQVFLPRAQPNVQSLDPFNALSGDCMRLQELLNNIC